MGNVRNGARSVLNLIAKACKLSRMNGFRVGVQRILGTAEAAQFFEVWDPFCAVVDLLIGADNYYNQIDFVQETGLGEDIGPA